MVLSGHVADRARFGALSVQAACPRGSPAGLKPFVRVNRALPLRAGGGGGVPALCGGPASAIEVHATTRAPARADLQHAGDRHGGGRPPGRDPRVALGPAFAGRRSRAASRLRRRPGALDRRLRPVAARGHPARGRRRLFGAGGGAAGGARALRRRRRREALDGADLRGPARLLGACAPERGLACRLRDAGRAPLRRLALPPFSAPPAPSPGRRPMSSPTP